MKSAIITGITGQDGSYLAKLLLNKGYRVIGVIRKNNKSDLFRLEFLGIKNLIDFNEIDLLNLNEVKALLEKFMPDEIYNLAAQSSVGLSFIKPSETFSFNSLSVINILDAIRLVNKKIKFYQASSSEMFGNVSHHNLPIKESLIFNPVSPYAISKATSHWMSINYRESFGLFSCCGILFNHESCLRSENFVIKKIINSAINIKKGKRESLSLGNIAIKRDWGYAPEYVKAMWMMLQQDEPDDYIICTGTSTTLLDFVKETFNILDLDLKFLKIDTNLIRNRELEVIYGSNIKAKKQLGWEYEMSTKELIQQLIKDEEMLIKWKENLII